MGYYDPSNIGVSDEVLASPTFWLVILVCYVITFGMRFAERTAGWAFRPLDSHILSEKVWAGRGAALVMQWAGAGCAAHAGSKRLGTTGMHSANLGRRLVTPRSRCLS